MSADIEDFLGYADGDGAFAAWCQEVDRLSCHFLTMSFFQFEGAGEPEDAYSRGVSPAQFMRDNLIPEVICAYGYDSVEELIIDNVLWGQTH